MAQNLKFTVTDPVGLYATPTTELVNTVTKAQVEIVTDGEDEKKAIEIIKDKINELGISTIE